MFNLCYLYMLMKSVWKNVHMSEKDFVQFVVQIRRNLTISQRYLFISITNSFVHHLGSRNSLRVGCFTFPINRKHADCTVCWTVACYARTAWLQFKNLIKSSRIFIERANHQSQQNVRVFGILPNFDDNRVRLVSEERVSRTRDCVPPRRKIIE